MRPAGGLRTFWSGNIERDERNGVCVSIRLVGSEQTTQEQRKAQERSRGKTNIRTIEDGNINKKRHKGRMCHCWMLAVLHLFLLRESVV